MKTLAAALIAVCLVAADAHADTISFDFAKGGNFDPSNGGGLVGPDTVTGITVETGKGNKDDYWQTSTSTAVVFTDRTSSTPSSTATRTAPEVAWASTRSPRRRARTTTSPAASA